MTSHGPLPHYVNLEVCWDGLWTLSFGLSQFCGQGSWLVCEVTPYTRATPGLGHANQLSSSAKGRSRLGSPGVAPGHPPTPARTDAHVRHYF